MKTSFAAAWKAAHDERDAVAIYQSLVDDNEHRRQRGLPTFEPSLDLARKILRACNEEGTGLVIRRDDPSVS